MTSRGEPPRPSIAFRLGVVGNRDLQDVDRAVLTGTVIEFLEQLRDAIDAAAAESREITSPEPYLSHPPRLWLLDSLAEGADQLVADAAIAGGFGYRIRCPLPFAANEYKSFFTYDREESIAAFDRITHDPDNDAVLVELTCSGATDRPDGYAAAADILLDNSDLLLAVYDPSRAGSEGGTAETVEKAVAAGVAVAVVDIREPSTVVLVNELPGTRVKRETLAADALRDVVASVLLPPGARGPARKADAYHDQLKGLRRYLREPLITGGALTRSLLRVANGFYGAFWSVVPWAGSLGAALRPRAHRQAPDTKALRSSQNVEAEHVIDEVQLPYRERLAPVDTLAGFYMNLYRGSFVMNFVLGAFAVLFALLSHFNHANHALWLRIEVVSLGVILINFIAARVWDWHGRALDYRFIAEYLRQMAALAPLGRSAPLIRPAAQYGGHDPSETWMGWYVRALDRDRGVIEFQTESSPAVLRMDQAFLDAMRARLCRDWLLEQLEYYRDIERRFRGAVTVFRALMLVLFVITVAAVVAHLMHLTISLDESSWREGAVLTIIVAALPAFLGALHGISVQAELEVTAERAGSMSAHLANALADMVGSRDPKVGSVAEISDRTVRAARMMLAEVLDWRIIHQAHEVELS